LTFAPQIPAASSNVTLGSLLSWPLAPLQLRLPTGALIELWSIVSAFGGSALVWPLVQVQVWPEAVTDPSTRFAANAFAVPNAPSAATTTERPMSLETDFFI